MKLHIIKDQNTLKFEKPIEIVVVPVLVSWCTSLLPEFLLSSPTEPFWSVKILNDIYYVYFDLQRQKW